MQHNNVQPLHQMRLFIQLLRELGARNAAHPHVIHGIGTEAELVRQAETEKIPRQREADNLAAPVRQQLVQPRHALGDAAGLAAGAEGAD